MRQGPSGFTLIELLVVMAIVATLLALVGPRYFASVDRSKETVLKTNLRITREAIDQFHADARRYPQTLQELVDQRYLREIPQDPITERRDTWILLAPGADGSGRGGEARAIYDLRSGAAGVGRDGTEYGSW
ncbi:type II secretion system GspH family protein [Schlegelella sp. S2-27]|uniref:Type II secretion system GspH family protein n=1 Tax=Caldimonas mangrovi TaxID=2944811 RepID=A0ABT0YS36_9BURK|nr:type II secretion system GspH family protein [Caldimonas mangrovi]